LVILIPEIEWQIINVYNQEYESAGAFWPDVHGRIVFALVVSQLLLMGLLSTKEAANSTPLLIALPVLTIWFHRFCKGSYEPAFTTHPLQVSLLLINNLCIFILSSILAI
jgi:glucose-6-phosphate-specific signal transduction histidine kinase